MTQQTERVGPLKPSTRASVLDMRVRAVLRDGTSVSIRPVRPDDKERVRAAFNGLSSTTVCRRFFHPKKELTEQELRVLTELDFCDHVSLAATVEHDGDQHFIAIGRFVRGSHSANHAELALTVTDAYQHRGVGTLLLKHIVAVAQTTGVRELLAFVQDDNRDMLALIEHTDLPMHRTCEDGVHRVILKLSETTEGRDGVPWSSRSDVRH